MNNLNVSASHMAEGEFGASLYTQAELSTNTSYVIMTTSLVALVVAIVVFTLISVAKKPKVVTVDNK